MGSVTRGANLTAPSGPRSSGSARLSTSRRRGSPADVRHRAGKRVGAGQSALPDLHAVLGHFNDALALVTVSQIAVAAIDVAALEECALRQGIAALNVVYDELDRADQQLRRDARDEHSKQGGAKRRP
jgi:hypothetical protein